ncbi:helix-turn-helix transcriptional regulator [Lactobacillus crispatus]
MINRLRKLREDKGLTLEEVGKGVGLAANTISRYETGKREPRLKTWQKLADFFSVSVSYLQGVDLNLDDMLKK